MLHFSFSRSKLRGLLLVIALTGAFFIGTCDAPGHAEEQKAKAEQIAQSYSSVNRRMHSSEEHYTTLCGGQRIDVEHPLREVVAELEAKHIRYGVGPLSDCSGIFYRVLQGLSQRCPEHESPAPEAYRDSRAIARWYHERGELVLIENALERTDLIKPGAVLFFGRNDSVYKKFTADQLFVPRSGIDHVGVVVKVHKDASGKVKSYELFHGHGRPGQTAASTTDWHLRDQTRPGYPPFGNGRQQLIAAARLLNPTKTLNLLRSKGQ